MTRTVCIVGAGIGAQHLEGYLALPDRFSVTSLCDLDEARAKAVASPHGVAVTTDIAAVLRDPAIDVIDICLPPHLHFSACMQALEAGKAVVCEKPLVPSLREADALAAKLAQTGGFLSAVFQYRYGLGTAQLDALIRAGLAGRCYAGSLETHWDRPAAYYSANTWRGTWKGESGGALLGHAIHIHDLLPAVLGPVEQVFADVGTRVNTIEVEDCAALSIRMESGALITSSVTLGCAENISRMRLMFEGFTVESDHAPYSLATKGWRFVARAPTLQADIDAVLEGVTGAKAGYAGMFEAMADALDGAGGREVTLQDARRSIEFVTACYLSARTNTPVVLPLGPDHPLYGSWLP